MQESSSEPSISIPVSLYEAMAVCFYGNGKRHHSSEQHDRAEGLNGLKDLNKNEDEGVLLEKEAMLSKDAPWFAERLSKVPEGPKMKARGYAAKKMSIPPEDVVISDPAPGSD